MADNFAYAATKDDLFGVVDLSTGVFTPLGDMGQRLTGLGVGPGGALYGSGYDSPTLYNVNPANGALTVVGNSSIGFYDMGSTTSGLFAEGNDGNLYSINPSKAAATLIGPTLLGNGMSTGSDTLYMTHGSTLYTLDTTTGAATLVGSSSSGVFGADVVVGGVIYGGSASPLAIYTLDGSNGAGTLIANVTGTSTNFWGLAPVDMVTPIVTVSIDSSVINLAHPTATVTFAFSEAPVAFTLSDTSAVGGTLSNLQQVNATTYTASFTGTANTDVVNASVSVTAGSYQDMAGNAGAGGSAGPFTVDTVTPTVAVSIDKTIVNLPDPTAQVTFTFSKPPIDFSLNDVTATNGSLSNLSGSGTTYTATFMANPGVDDNTATVSVINGSYHDAAGNAGVGTTTMLPVAFSSAVATFYETEDGSDWAPSQMIDGIITAPNGGRNGWSVNDGSNGSEAADALLTIASPLAAGAYTLTFNLYQNYYGNPGHILGDFALAYTTASSPTLSSPQTRVSIESASSLNGTTYSLLSPGELLANTSQNPVGTDTYTISASVDAASPITGIFLDAIKNPTLPGDGPGYGSGNGNFVVSEFTLDASTGGSTGPFTVDTVTPTVAVSINNTDVNVGNPTGLVMFTFSEAPVAFTLSDTSAVGGTLSNLQQVNATTYTASFTGAPDTDIANASASVTAGSYQDVAGNAGAGGSTAPFTVDTLAPPTVAVSIDNTDVNVANPTALVTFTFSRAPTDFSLNDVTATNGSLSNLSGSGTTYTATFMANPGVDDNTATVSVINGSYHDAAGNAGVGTTTMLPVAFSSAVATFYETEDGSDWAPSQMIDGIITAPNGGRNGWSVNDGSNGSEAADALLTIASPLAAGAYTLTFNLYQNYYGNPGHILGDFALAYTTASSPTLSSPQTRVSIESASSLNGTTYSLLSPGELLANTSQNPVGTDTYTISASVDAASPITGIFLDAIKNPTLPGDGPGYGSGNGNFVVSEFTLDASTGGSTGPFTVDTVTPTVAVSINNTDVNVGNPTGLVMFTFSEAPVAFTLSDTSAVGGTLSNLQQTDATHYTATFTGAPNIDISNASVSVTAGSWQEGNGNAGAGGSTSAFTVDTVTPTASVAVSSSDVNLANNTAMVTFAFSEAPASFALADASAVGGTLSNLQQTDATHYTATFTGAPNIDISNASVSVTAGSWQEGNGNAGAGGSTSAFTVDTVTPTASVAVSNSDVNLANNTAMVTFTFSEAPTDFSLAHTSAVGGTLGNLSGSGTTYTAVFTAAAGKDISNGSVSVDSTWHEANGNPGTGATSAAFVVDTVTPTVVVSINSTTLNLAHNTATVTFTFSEAPVSFVLSDTSAVGGTLSNLQKINATQYTAIFTAATNTLIHNALVNVTAGSWQEGNSNAGAAGSTGNFIVDTMDHWTNVSGGKWTTASSWSNGVPSANVEAAVDTNGTYTVSITTADTAYALLLNDSGATVSDNGGGTLTLVGTGGSSNPNGVLAINAGTFALAGGALKSGSISVASGGGVLLVSASYTGFSNAIVDNGSITVSGKNSSFASNISGSGAINIQNGAAATFNGAITGSEAFTITNTSKAIVNTAITGTGSFALSGSGSLELGAADSENVTFTSGATGTLKLDHSLTMPFTGYLSGLSTKNAVDLADLAWNQGKMKATFSGNTSGGTLTVTNGTNRVALKLLGNYTTASWTLSKDATGGTRVVDPPATGSPTKTENRGGTIDFSDITFGANSTLGYSANTDKPGGALTVSDGLHTHTVALLGQYMASSFAMASDGHGGTLVTDPGSNQQPLLTHPHG